MLPDLWSSPCGNHCNNKFSALMQIPWRVFCKKGCDCDGDTWEDCVGECNEICYKDPVLKDHQWSAYIDRSPGADHYSSKCFHACIAGCAHKFNIPSATVDMVHPNRPPKPQPTPSPAECFLFAEDVPCTSA
ncbi:hypothetical protein AMTRI_Chr07g82060 [Amborella trichopoda]|uniref:uncharacterized protein LOC18423142 isoform X1 n=1 Tax=Amborella trichopoda TaxID=13333 RepID=UPI0005D3BB1D|nr:uncharacterized protein LOC18423142 isoform X1 [Amborella trichopoda]|eukprot:XP_011625512.1 uncharacterized protein LOC18423142 isoform X1 [Amborella trichopoda]